MRTSFHLWMVPNIALALEQHRFSIALPSIPSFRLTCPSLSPNCCLSFLFSDDQQTFCLPIDDISWPNFRLARLPWLLLSAVQVICTGLSLVGKDALILNIKHTFLHSGRTSRIAILPWTVVNPCQNSATASQAGVRWLAPLFRRPSLSVPPSSLQ